MSVRKETKIIAGEGTVLVLHEGTEIVDLMKILANNSVNCIRGSIDVYIKGESWNLELTLNPIDNVCYKAQVVLTMTEGEPTE